MASFLKEFRDFAMRGNVLDLAVGFIMGAAFGKIVTSLVSDILMPPLGVVLGSVDFSNLFVTLSSQHYTSLADASPWPRVCAAWRAASARISVCCLLASALVRSAAS